MPLGADVLYHYPTKYTKRGCSIRVEGSHHGTNSTVKRTASVEAEPSEPDEHGTDEDQCGVVGFSVDLVAFVQTLAEDKSIRECRPSRCNVDRATSGEIEGREVEQPTVPVALLAVVCRFFPSGQLTHSRSSKQSGSRQ